MSRISAERLRSLRNGIDVDRLLRDQLRVATRVRGGWLRFLCPVCGEFDTATNPRTNLARSFRCRRNFNSIDLVMVVRRCGFRDAVDFLEKRVKPANSRGF